MFCTRRSSASVAAAVAVRLSASSSSHQASRPPSLVIREVARTTTPPLTVGIRESPRTRP